jgi:ribosome recycling factor
MTEYMDDLELRMTLSLDSYNNNLTSVRTGRATPDLLNQIKVEIYNDFMPLNQLANISVQDGNLLIVQPWDKASVSAVEKAIKTSNLGVNPAIDGNVIRVPIPKLSEERRVELSKVCANYAEQAKVSIRNIRRDILDKLKKQQKNSEISEDELRDFSDNIQKNTDSYINKIEESLLRKKEEIMVV